VVWQGSVGDRLPYANQTPLWAVTEIVPLSLVVRKQLTEQYQPKLSLPDVSDPCGSFRDTEPATQPRFLRIIARIRNMSRWVDGPMTLNAVYLSQSIRRAILRVLLFWRTSQGSDQFAYAVRDAK
jgi:hypothetical protein